MKHRAVDAEIAEWAARAAAEKEALAREKQREARRQARVEQVRRELHERGFSDGEIKVIWDIHVDIRAAKMPWREIKRRYHDLMPPYTPYLPRQRASYTLRETVYQEQQGRCFYCKRTLLPLSVWKQGRRDGRSAIDQMREDQMTQKIANVQWARGIPELDHKIPVSRGGGLTRENLCYACRSCNQSKLHRTASEFALFPHDPISELKLDLGLIYHGIQVEAQGYYDFDALPLSASRRRFPAL